MTIEAELWASWRTRRNESSFERLVQPHLTFLQDFARRLGCSRADADDAIQATLIDLANHDGERPIRVGVRAWLGRGVRRHASMIQRAGRRRQRREKLAANPERVRDPELLQDQVSVALSRLDAKSREIIVLRFLNDLEYREIAHIVGRSRAACRLRVHRAIARLRRDLGPNAGSMLAALPLLADRADARVALARGSIKAAQVGGGVLMSAKAKFLISGVILLISGGALWSYGRDARAPVRAKQTAAVDPRWTNAIVPESGESAELESTDDSRAGIEESPATSGAGLRDESAESPNRRELRVLVTRDGTPVRNAIVYLLESARGSWPLRLGIPKEKLPKKQLRVGGSCRFTDPGSGMFLVRVEIAGIAVPQVGRVLVESHKPIPRCIIRVGTSEVRGLAIGAAGAPDPGAKLLVRVELPDKTSYPFELVSDARGEYRIDNLPECRLVIRCYTGIQTGKRSELRSYIERIDVGPDAQLEVDFGKRRGRATWTGRLLGAADEPISVMASLKFFGRDGHRNIEVPVGRDGTFTAILPVGTYTVYAHLPGPDGLIKMQEISVDGTNHQREFSIAGSTVHGAAVSFALREPARMWVSVREVSTKGLSWRAQIAEDGTFSVFALPTGTFEAVLYRRERDKRKPLVRVASGSFKVARPDEVVHVTLEPEPTD